MKQVKLQTPALKRLLPTNDIIYLVKCNFYNRLDLFKTVYSTKELITTYKQSLKSVLTLNRKHITSTEIKYQRLILEKFINEIHETNRNSHGRNQVKSLFEDMLIRI